MNDDGIYVPFSRIVFNNKHLMTGPEGHSETKFTVPQGTSH